MLSILSFLFKRKANQNLNYTCTDCGRDLTNDELVDVNQKKQLFCHGYRGEERDRCIDNYCMKTGEVQFGHVKKIK